VFDQKGIREINEATLRSEITKNFQTGKVPAKASDRTSGGGSPTKPVKGTFKSVARQGSGRKEYRSTCPGGGNGIRMKETEIVPKEGTDRRSESLAQKPTKIVRWISICAFFKNLRGREPALGRAATQRSCEERGAPFRVLTSPAFAIKSLQRRKEKHVIRSPKKRRRKIAGFQQGREGVVATGKKRQVHDCLQLNKARDTLPIFLRRAKDISPIGEIRLPAIRVAVDVG